MMYFGNVLAAGAVVLATLAAPPVRAVGPLADVSTTVGEAVSVDLSAAFAVAIAYALAPSSASLPVGLALSGDRIAGMPTEPATRRTLVVRGSNGRSFADSAFEIEVAALAPPAEPPVLVTAPELLGTPLVGATIDAQPGVWTGAEAVTTELLVGGVAVVTPYTVRPADDGQPVVLRETAAWADGAEVRETDPVRVAYPAPSLDALTDVTATVGDADPTVQATGAGLVGGAWSVTGPAASIDATGLVTIDTVAQAVGAVTVSYTNSGGTATASFLVTVSPAAGGGSGPWTPDELTDATFAVYLATDATVTRDGSGNVTGWSALHASGAAPAFGRATVGATVPGANPAAWDAVNALIDFGAGLDSALVGALPFTLSINSTRGFTVVWATVGATAGDAINTRLANDTSRYRFGPASWMGSAPSGAGDGAPRIGVIEGWNPGSGRLRRGWKDGQRFTSDAGDSVTSGSFSGDATAAILGSSNASNLMPGKIAAVAFFDRRLTDAERERVEGWLKHAHPALNGLTLTAFDGGGAHPYETVAPQLGAAPILAAPIPDLPANEDVLIDEIDLREYFFFADSFSVSGAPAGVSLLGPILRGAPTAAGSFAITVTALNGSGATQATFTLTVAAAPAVATDIGGLWSAAFSAAPGDMIQVANLAGIVQGQEPTVNGPDFLTALAELTGTETVMVAGATDFRRADWATNLDAEVKVHLPHRNASGSLVSGNATRVHPMWGENPSAFESKAAPAGPVAIDHASRGGVWVPSGLRVWDGASAVNNALGAAVGSNALRHRHAHDGHVVWIAEYLTASGARIVLADELSNTRGANPRLRHRKRVLDGDRPTHLLRFVTLQIRSHAQLADQTPASHWDARRWQLAPKRLRSAYGPAPAANPIDYAATDWSDAMAHIAALSVADGVIGGKAPGVDYVIELPPGLHAGTEGDRRLRLPANTRSKLSFATQNRVFIVGTPGETILHAPEFEADSRIDFGWVTIAPTQIAPSPTSSMFEFRGTGSHVRFFGSVIDGLDGTPQVGKVGHQSVFEFYDGIVTGCGNGIGTAPLSTGDTYAQRLNNAARVVVARSLYDVTNDGMTIYGAGNIRFEANYSYGNGGLYLNNGMAHRDAGGQFAANGNLRQPSVIAYYDNMFDTGPNRNLWISDRAATNTLMMQGLQWEAFDYVANIVVQTPHGDGVTRMANARKDMTKFASLTSWLYSAHFARNILIQYPSDYTPEGGYPGGAFNSFSGGGTSVFDGWAATDNIIIRDTASGQVGFSRLLNMFPEEQVAPARADHLDPSEAFASFPAFTGTWATGYVGNWSATTYGGTSREGYLAPQDVAVSVALQSWGAAGGPGLPQHGAYLDRYTGLPADVNAHLGFDVAGSGYGADWFGPGAWAPAAFTPNASVVAPWTPPAGLAAPDAWGLIVNTRIAAAGSGTLIREVAADGSDWRVRIEADGRPRFVMRDALGAVIHDVTGQKPVGAGDHLAMIANVKYRRHKAEGFSYNTSVQRMIREHYAASADELVAVFYAQDAAPTRETPPGGVFMRHFWADTAHSNRLYEWDGAAWALMNGEASQWASVQFADASRKNPNPAYDPADPDNDSPTINQWGNGLRKSTINGPRKFRIILKAQLAGAPSTTLTPSAGVTVAGVQHDMDRLYYARGDGAYAATDAVFRWLDGAWTAGGASVGGPDAGVFRGEVGVHFRVNGAHAVRGDGWVWGNEDVFYGAVFDRWDVDTPDLTIPYGFPLLAAADLRVATRAWVVKARSAGDPPGTPERYLAFEGGFRSIDPALYSISGVGNPDGGTVTLASIDALYAAARARPENLGVAVDFPAVTVRKDGSTVTAASRKRVIVHLSLNIAEPVITGEIDPTDGDADTDSTGGYGADTALPVGTVQIGTATGEGFTGTVRFIEARRLDGTRAADRPVDGASTAIVHRLARAPVDPATGERDHPILGPADIWEVAP